MSLAINSLTVDSHDPRAVAAFWSAALDWAILFECEDAAADQDAEVARLEGLGARRADIGQGEVDWVVMADVEDNEFCVLRSLPKEETE